MKRAFPSFHLARHFIVSLTIIMNDILQNYLIFLCKTLYDESSSKTVFDTEIITWKFNDRVIFNRTLAKWFYLLRFFSGTFILSIPMQHDHTVTMKHLNFPGNINSDTRRNRGKKIEAIRQKMEKSRTFPEDQSRDNWTSRGRSANDSSHGADSDKRRIRFDIFPFLPLCYMVQGIQWSTRLGADGGRNSAVNICPWMKCASLFAIFLVAFVFPRASLPKFFERNRSAQRKKRITFEDGSLFRLYEGANL